MGLDRRGVVGRTPNWEVVWLDLHLAEKPRRGLDGGHGGGTTRGAAGRWQAACEKVVGRDEGKRAGYARHYAEIYRIRENFG